MYPKQIKIIVKKVDKWKTNMIRNMQISFYYCLA